MKTRRNMYLIIFFAVAYHIYTYLQDTAKGNPDIDKQGTAAEIFLQTDSIPLDSYPIIGLKNCPINSKFIN